VNISSDYLRLNVGFIIHETAGYFRDFPFEVDSIRLSEDLELRQLIGTVRVTRAAQGLLVQVKMKAAVSAECVRCLEMFDQPLLVDYSDLYAFNPNSLTESGLRVPDTGKIDLAPILREEMILAIPISPVCEPNCKGLCLVCGENLNFKECEHTG